MRGKLGTWCLWRCAWVSRRILFPSPARSTMDSAKRTISKSCRRFERRFGRARLPPSPSARCRPGIGPSVFVQCHFKLAGAEGLAGSVPSPTGRGVGGEGLTSSNLPAGRLIRTLPSPQTPLPGERGFMVLQREMVQRLRRAPSSAVERRRAPSSAVERRLICADTARSLVAMHMACRTPAWRARLHNPARPVSAAGFPACRSH